MVLLNDYLTGVNLWEA